MFIVRQNLPFLLFLVDKVWGTISVKGNGDGGDAKVRGGSSSSRKDGGLSCYRVFRYR